MWNVLKAVSGTVAVTIMLATVASAHHSMAEFEGAKDVTIEGVVSELKWVNPHASVFVDAATIDGQAVKGQNWAAEMPSPRGLPSRGLTKESLKVGTKVTISGPARRDGAPIIILREIKLADGKRVTLRVAAD